MANDDRGWLFQKLAKELKEEAEAWKGAGKGK